MAVGIICGLLMISISFSFGVIYPEEIEKYEKRLEEISNMEIKPSPKKQLGELEFKDVMCNQDFVALFKWNANELACVSESTADALQERDWGILRSKVKISEGFGCGYKITFSSDFDVHEKTKTKILRKVMVQEFNTWIEINPGLESNEFFFGYGYTEESAELQENLKTELVDLISEIRFTGCTIP